MSTLTYVTAYLNIYGDSPPNNRSDKWRLQQFRMLAESGIYMCVFVSPDCHSLLQDFIQDFPNIHLMDPITLTDTKIAKTCCDFSHNHLTYSLPSSRTIEKDTEKYIQLQSCKMEFMQNASIENPWKSTHFAWIDFSIAHMMKDHKSCQDQLIKMSKCSFEPAFFAIPGIWKEWNIKQDIQYYDNIHWRFCGSFFIGDRLSILRFCQAYQTHFSTFLYMHRKLIWEVNVWAWMEAVLDKYIWNPIWYKASHNETCLQIPDYLMYGKIPGIPARRTYHQIKHFNPTSSAYFLHNGIHWLNMRYVNYWITPQGRYLYSDGSKIIENKNVLYILSQDASYTGPIVQEMNDQTVNLPKLTHDGCSRGLEDMRIFTGESGQLKFIATSVEYSPTGRNRMVMGNYHVDTASYSNCFVIVPPKPDSWTEKNWIPVLHNGITHIIYQWCPMEIGQIVDQTTEKGEVEKHLEIITRYETGHLPWFNHFRGSTTFTETEEGLVGLVHFSKEDMPRKYYHCLMILDKDNLRPVKYSAPFYFQNVGVEFCIGMAVQETTYAFWISQMDRDPLMIIVEKKDISTNFVIV